MSNDDIRSVAFKKSARVGYTKMIVAAIGYYAEHRRRNQVVWQPVDDDADDFCKDEIDPMLRDCAAVQRVFPYYDKKCKQNTLSKKCFRGSTLDIRGGKAPKNYRRMSKDVAYFDELSGFDANIGNEGDARTLGETRLQGATFPKSILGSTPKLAGSCQIDAAYEAADVRFKYHVPCPRCGHEQVLRWGGPGATFGLKWRKDDPAGAHYLCESAKCGKHFSYDEYISHSLPRGRWVGDNGIWIDDDSRFRSPTGEIVDAPLHVAFHIWAGYSPQVTWAELAREFVQAVKSKDRSKLQTFVNTKLGECWEEDVGERDEPDVLRKRREHYAGDAAGNGDVPNGVQVVTVGIDTQDDRFELQFDGYGWEEERWSLDYVRLYGDPSRPEIWNKLAEQLRRKFVRRDGIVLEVRLACQDQGGHYADEVVKFSLRMGVRFLVPTHGANTYGKPVANWPRKRTAKRVYLTEVGTDTAKSLLHQRYQIQEPGPGYVHWPVRDCFDETYFEQVCAEERVKKWSRGVAQYVWDAKGRRNEATDCSVLTLVAVRILQQHFGLTFQPYIEPTAAALADSGAADLPAAPLPAGKPKLKWR